MKAQVIIASAFCAAVLTGCVEFRPMYAAPPTGASTERDIGRDLSRIRLAPAEGRVGVQLRNDLIFELTGRGDDPESAEYELSIRTSTSSSSTVIGPIAGIQQAALVVVTAHYRLERLRDRTVVTSGALFSRVSYDQVTVQRFAGLRAQRDAEDRASRELAGLIRNRIAVALVAPSRTEAAGARR